MTILDPDSLPAVDPSIEVSHERRLEVTDHDHRRWRHELRTPLNQILGYSQMLQEDAADLGQAQFVEDLRKIELAGKRLVELVDEMTGGASASDSAHPPPTAPPRRSGATAPPASASRGGRILVVDDNEMNRDLLSRRLGQQGFRVEVAASGEETLEAVARESWDLILLDVVMPGIGGLGALVALREQHDPAALPVIMATARDSSEDVVAALQAGANDYVTKPLDFAVVLARVETQLSLKRARDEVGELNARLAAAQERLGRLVEDSSSSLDDVGAWANAVAREVAEAVGARHVGVWLFEAQLLTKIAGDTTEAPSVSDLATMGRTGRHLVRASDTVVPILGLSGEIYGALVLEADLARLGEAGDRVVSTFARHLGGALEMKRLRKELAAAADRRRESRESLIQRGVDLLQVCPQCRRCYDHRAEHCAVDGAALDAPRVFPVHVAGRYRLTRLVGEGGMGTVFQARDVRLERDVAVKVIKAEHFNDATVRYRFEQEARAVARIDHPGVVGIFDSGELEDGSLFIVMEWLEGSDLGRLLRRVGRGTPRQVVALLSQSASALGAAHSARLVHRDVKPENLLLVPGQDGFRVKVLDFGVAKEMTSDTGLTRTGSLVGTPLYMSPEQLLGRSIDPRSDLYSLAAVGYQALTGRRVVQAEHFAEVLFEVVNAVPAPPSSLVPEIPQVVDEAFLRALAKDPTHRPASATEWVESFAAVLAALEPGAPGWLDEDGRLRQGPTEEAAQDGDTTLDRGSLPDRIA